MFLFFPQSSNSEKDYAVKEVEGLFYQESLFNRVITIGGGVVGSLMFIGLVWEFSYWRKKHAGKDTCPLVRCNGEINVFVVLSKTKRSEKDNSVIINWLCFAIFWATLGDENLNLTSGACKVI